MPTSLAQREWRRSDHGCWMRDRAHRRSFGKTIPDVSRPFELGTGRIEKKTAPFHSHCQPSRCMGKRGSYGDLPCLSGGLGKRGEDRPHCRFSGLSAGDGRKTSSTVRPCGACSGSGGREWQTDRRLQPHRRRSGSNDPGDTRKGKYPFPPRHPGKPYRHRASHRIRDVSEKSGGEGAS